MTHIRWPGFSARGTLLLPLDLAAWLPDASPRWLDGRRFEPKREVHVTLLGTAAAQAVRAALAAGHGSEAELARRFESLDWQPRRTGPWLHLRKPGDADPVQPACDAESIIARIELPAMAAFRAEASRLTGVPLPPAPPHVTLYVRGSPEGIGLPDEAALARYLVAPVDPACLAIRSPHQH